MKYPEKTWIIYQGEPYFIDYYSKFYKKYLLKKHTAREYEIATEDEIEDIYPVDDIPIYDIGQTVITLTGQITQVTRTDEDDCYKPYFDENNEWYTPFEITNIDY